MSFCLGACLFCRAWLIPSGGYPGEVSEEGVPVDFDDYKAWFENLPREWIVKPCVSHFVVVPKNINQSQLQSFIDTKFEKDDITTIDKEIVHIFLDEVKKRTNCYHIGKNFSIEAFYKINIEQVENLQNNGFVSLENGELNTLAAISNVRNVKFGAIFYSYYNPLEDWIVPWFQEDYKKCVELEGEITLATIKRIANENYKY